MNPHILYIFGQNWVFQFSSFIWLSITSYAPVIHNTIDPLNKWPFVTLKCPTQNCLVLKLWRIQQHFPYRARMTSPHMWQVRVSFCAQIVIINPKLPALILEECVRCIGVVRKIIYFNPLSYMCNQSVPLFATLCFICYVFCARICKWHDVRYLVLFEMQFHFR